MGTNMVPWIGKGGKEGVDSDTALPIFPNAASSVSPTHEKTSMWTWGIVPFSLHAENSNRMRV